MKNKRLYILLFVVAVALIFATSCKTTKQTTTTTTVTPQLVVDNHVALNEIKHSDEFPHRNIRRGSVGAG